MECSGLRQSAAHAPSNETLNRPAPLTSALPDRSFDRVERIGDFLFGIAQALLGDPKLLIVDEPTAGLDPGERNRFYNLLSEVGESVVVILSTHIVEDVTDLCPHMAIISHGQVLIQGEPQASIEALKGKVWRRSINKSALADASLT